MIVGIGTDIIEIERFEALVCWEHFMNRVFTETEREYIQKRANRAAGMFGVKEAFSKAVGTGLSGFSLQDVEVVHDEYGKPLLNLYGRAQERFGGLSFQVSISHCDCHAVAFVTASKE